MVPATDALNSGHKDSHTNKIIILAGGTGKLGQRIAYHLVQKGASVRALIRKDSRVADVNAIEKLGAAVKTIDYAKHEELTTACTGGSCVVSALSGLRPVIVDAQTQLLNAAVAAGIPRFIPSDYCIDYTKLPEGGNRNLDLRREFAERINQTPIAATSILNGMFADLLTGQAPVILFGLKRVIYWGDADQLMDFTTMEDTAAYTAAAALDPTTPRLLRIAGDVLSSKGLAQAASVATGKVFKPFRLGGLTAFTRMIKITRTLTPSNDEVFPPWQGMQYLHDMYTGLPKLSPLDDDRYAPIRWTSVKEVLAARNTNKK